VAPRQPSRLRALQRARTADPSKLGWRLSGGLGAGRAIDSGVSPILSRHAQGALSPDAEGNKAKFRGGRADERGPESIATTREYQARPGDARDRCVGMPEQFLRLSIEKTRRQPASGAPSNSSCGMSMAIAVFARCPWRSPRLAQRQRANICALARLPPGGSRDDCSVDPRRHV
jgi:hypothetical protein